MEAIKNQNLLTDKRFESLTMIDKEEHRQRVNRTYTQKIDATERIYVLFRDGTTKRHRRIDSADSQRVR